MKNIKNKKIVFFFVFLLLFGIVGTTFAFVLFNGSFDSVFHTNNYVVEAIDYFESPSNWAPGDTTEKDLIVTNKGNTDVAVRVSFEEEWLDANNQPLPLVDANNQPISILNFYDDVSNWIRKGNYYYYVKKLTKNESTTPLLKSVTFSPEVLTDECTGENGNINCYQTAGDYSGGKYHLNVKVETSQYNLYRDVFDYDVSISANANPQQYIYVALEDLDVPRWGPVPNVNYYSNASDISSPVFLRLSTFNEQVVHAMVGYRINNNTYYLSGGLSHKEENLEIFNNLFREEDCYDRDDGYYCYDDSKDSFVGYDGRVYLSIDGSMNCGIDASGCGSCWRPA